jgi:putative resolvase
MSSLLSIGEVCRLTNTHPNSIRKYTDNGSLRCYRVADNGMRRFRRDDVEEFFGLRKREEIVSGGKIVIIARVSDGRRSIGFTKDNGQLSDLSRQVARLRAVAKEQYNEEYPLVFAETGSGLNFERKQFNSLIDRLLSGEIRNATILATRPERILRIGRPLFEKVCRWANCKIVYTEQDEAFENEESESPAQLITEFMASIISKIYSRRSAERNTKKLSPQIIERLRQWRAAGKSINAIVKESKTLGFKTDDGAFISYKVCQRILNVESPQLEMNRENSIERFIALKVRRGASGLRLKKSDCYGAYRKFVTENNLPVLSASLVGRKLNSIGIKSSTIPKPDRGNYKTWAGIYLVDDEKLSVLVKEVKKPVSAESPHHNSSFFLFFSTVLAGHVWRASDILARYKAWAKERGLRRELRPTIIRILGDLGFTSEIGKTGTTYDLRSAEKLLDLGLPLRPMLATWVKNR